MQLERSGYFQILWSHHNRIIPIHILLIISRSKGNKMMKFGQLIEYNMKSIFLEKSFTKGAGETIPKFFSKKSKLTIPSDQYFEVSYSLFLLFILLYSLCQVEDFRNILKLSSRPLGFTSYKVFLNQKPSSGTSLPATFSAWFLKKNISLMFN